MKVKVRVGLRKYSPFAAIKTVRSYKSTLVRARKLVIILACLFI